MIPAQFVLVGAALNVVGLGQLRARHPGRAHATQPGDLGLWALAPLIAFAAEIQQGVGPVSRS